MSVSAPTSVQPLAADHTTLGKIVVVDVTLDSLYADGGEAFDLGQLGINEAWFVSIEQKLPSAADATVYTYQWDYDANKIIVTSGAAEVATNTALDTYTVRIFVYGLSS